MAKKEKNMSIIMLARDAENMVESALEEAAQATQRHLQMSEIKLVIIDVITLRWLLEGFREYDRTGR